MVYTNQEMEELGLTKQRKMVLQVISESKDHLTANEVFERAKVDLPSISFATVYNSLRYLKEAGHIAEISFASGASRFDRITTRHDHALCNSCGKLADLDIKLPEELLSLAAQRSNFEPDSIELTLRGICPECQK